MVTKSLLVFYSNLNSILLSEEPRLKSGWLNCLKK